LLCSDATAEVDTRTSRDGDSPELVIGRRDDPPGMPTREYYYGDMARKTQFPWLAIGQGVFGADATPTTSTER
jgi:hypothetical protein